MTLPWTGLRCASPFSSASPSTVVGCGSAGGRRAGVPAYDGDRFGQLDPRTTGGELDYSTDNAPDPALLASCSDKTGGAAASRAVRGA
eukprot:1369346-Rhodomonas_salina.1